MLLHEGVWKGLGVPRRRVEEPDEVDRAIQASFEDERRRLADGVKGRRKARGWSQERLAEQARLSTIYISHLELARVNVNPTLHALASLAYALECQVGELGGGPRGLADAPASGPVYRARPRPADGTHASPTEAPTSRDAAHDTPARRARPRVKRLAKPR